jgi:regulator of sigma E protease
MELLSTIFYFVLVLGILVLVHEFGHFIAAKLSGMRAEVFSIGMGPRFIGYHKKTGITFGKMPEGFDPEDNTEYRLSIFPIGGYVKIAGMIDESMDKEFIGKEPQPWEFRSKNPFQKIFVLSAGVIMNFLLAVAIFGSLSFFLGQNVLVTTKIGWVEPKSIAEKIGLQTGDKIISINNHPSKSWNDILENLTLKQLGKTKSIIVDRNGSKLKLEANGKAIVRSIADKKPIGIEPDGIRVVFNTVETLKPAGQVGFKKYDTVLTVDGINIFGVSQFSSYIKSHKGKEISITFKRSNIIDTLKVTPNESGMIGVALFPALIGKIEHQKYGIFESLAEGFNESVNAINLFIGSMSQIFNGTLSFKESVGGPVMIAQQASQQAEMGIASFLNFIALLSVTLAIINILPLPVLDGGHLVFVIIEAIIRREVSPKVKIVIQQAGFVLFLLLMMFVIYNDFTR